MRQVTIDQALQIAVGHIQAKQLQQAAEVLRQILAQQPEHADALYFMGSVAHQLGQRDAAADLIRRALAVRSNWPEACYHLGLVLHQSGKTDQAIEAYAQTIMLRPGFAEAHNNIGVALGSKGRAQEAIASFARAISLQPGYAEAHNNLGSMLKSAGQIDDAIASFKQAILLRPNYAEAFSNLGGVLREKGQLDFAIDALQQAIRHNPGIPEAYNELGIALKMAGRLDDAVAAYRQSVALRPGYAEVYRNLGITFKAKGQVDNAIAAFKKAMALQPAFLKAHSNLAYAMPFHPAYSAREICDETHRWSLQYAEPLTKLVLDVSATPRSDRRLRIGYVSPDLYSHPIGRLLLPLLANHDRSLFEIFVYAQVTGPDAISDRLRLHIDCWRDIVGMPDQQVADLIRQDEVDILVDLTMHMANNRLLVFARKPAPMQVTWLGYPGTTGMTAIDYRLSDPYLDPPGMDESVYSEKTIRLPNSFWCYDALEAAEIPIGALPALQARWVTFGCLNNFCKVNDVTLALWSRVLGAMPNSRLIMLCPAGEHRRHVLEQLAVSPGRVDFLERLPREKYLQMFNLIDIALDTVPYNGHTTSLDSIWMGVPVVTLVGETIVGRAGVSQLMNLGLQSLAGKTPKEFQDIAVSLANDLPRLASLRAGLRDRMKSSPLMDAPTFAKNIEDAFRQMWQSIEPGNKKSP